MVGWEEGEACDEGDGGGGEDGGWERGGRWRRARCGDELGAWSGGLECGWRAGQAISGWREWDRSGSAERRIVCFSLATDRYFTLISSADLLLVSWYVERTIMTLRRPICVLVVAESFEAESYPETDQIMTDPRLG